MRALEANWKMVPMDEAKAKKEIRKCHPVKEAVDKNE